MYFIASMECMLEADGSLAETPPVYTYEVLISTMY